MNLRETLEYASVSRLVGTGSGCKGLYIFFQSLFHRLPRLVAIAPEPVLLRLVGKGSQYEPKNRFVREIVNRTRLAEQLMPLPIPVVYVEAYVMDYRHCRVTALLLPQRMGQCKLLARRKFVAPRGKIPRQRPADAQDVLLHRLLLRLSLRAEVLH